MSYNSLDKGYIHVSFPADADTSLQKRLDYMDLLADVLQRSGWTIQQVPYRFTVTTSFTDPLVPTHTFCDLYNIPGAEDTLFSIEFSDTGPTGYFVIDSNISCFDIANYDPEGESIDVGYGEIFLPTIYGNPPSESNWIAYVSDNTYPNISATHAIVWKGGVKQLLDRGDVTEVTYLETIDNGGALTSSFYAESTAALDYYLEFGGFLQSSGSYFEGKGFIATSPPNGDTDNFIQLYIYANPQQTSVLINVAYGEFDFRVPYTNGSGETFTHPLSMVEELEGSTSVSVTGWIFNSLQMHGYVGPYFVIFETTDSNRYFFAGCLDIHDLETPGSNSISRMRFHHVTAGVTNEYSEIKLNGTSVIRSGGANLMNMNRYSLLDTIQFFSADSKYWIFWGGSQDICPAFETWAGFDPYDATNPPLIGTIPGTLRQASNAATSRTITQQNSDIPFVFDDHLWMYWENRFAPIAFWIKEPRIYDYNGFSNKVPMYKVSSASLSPSAFTPGSTNTLTITIALVDQPYTNLGGFVIVHVDNARISISPDYYVTFAPDALTATVDLVENGLGITETVNIKIFHNDGEDIYVLPVVAT